MCTRAYPPYKKKFVGQHWHACPPIIILNRRLSSEEFWPAVAPAGAYYSCPQTSPAIARTCAYIHCQYSSPAVTRTRAKLIVNIFRHHWCAHVPTFIVNNHCYQWRAHASTLLVIILRHFGAHARQRSLSTNSASCGANACVRSLTTLLI